MTYRRIIPITQQAARALDEEGRSRAFAHVAMRSVRFLHRMGAKPGRSYRKASS